jgi:hypothetical protein
MDLRTSPIELSTYNIPVFRDIRDTFDYPPFRRLLNLMKDNCTADPVKMFMEIYMWIEDSSPHQNSWENIRRLKQLIDDGGSRQSLCEKYMDIRRKGKNDLILWGAGAGGAGADAGAGDGDGDNDGDDDGDGDDRKSEVE